MKTPSKEQIVNWLLQSYTMKDTSLPGICHCINVGLAMEAVAKSCKLMDPKEAKIIGLLHDVGKIDVTTNPYYEGNKRAHDIVGFDFLRKEGFPEIAYGSLTHSLLSKDLDNEYNKAMFFYNADDLKRLRSLLKDHTYSETEKLLQLCDWIIQKDHVCTIENSYEFIKKYYGYYEGLDDSLKEALKIKKHFDDACKKDIYDICKSVIISKWNINNLENFIRSII